MSKNIYLVGFMGTGKTSSGKELARMTRRRFIDIDELIERKEKISIRDIFSRYGEDSFRKLETKYLKEVSKKDNLVVACGGGIVVKESNISLMKKTGFIVCLKASVNVILKRTACYTHRPLLNVKDQKQMIKALLCKRKPFYSKADITLDTSRLSIRQTAKRIFKISEKNEYI